LEDKSGIIIRPAVKKDVGLIFSFIKELADYEKLADAVTADENLLMETLFGKEAVPKSLLAFYEDKPAGFAIYFYNFSTFIGKPGLFLEDVYVRKELRGKGIGKRILIYLAKVAKEKDCGRFEWSVLDWNEPSIKFYKNLGAKPMDDWTVFRLDRQGIENLAGQ
jgi:GNAT superfamily N-acetyltransferase